MGGNLELRRIDFRRYAPRWLIGIGLLELVLAAVFEVGAGVGWRVPVHVAAENPDLLMFEWDRL